MNPLFWSNTSTALYQKWTDAAGGTAVGHSAVGLNTAVNQLDVTDSYWLFHSTTENTFFSSSHMKHSLTQTAFWAISTPQHFLKIETICSMLSSTIKLNYKSVTKRELGNSKIFGSYTTYF